MYDISKIRNITPLQRPEARERPGRGERRPQPALHPPPRNRIVVHRGRRYITIRPNAYVNAASEWVSHPRLAAWVYYNTHVIPRYIAGSQSADAVRDVCERYNLVYRTGTIYVNAIRTLLRETRTHQEREPDYGETDDEEVPTWRDDEDQAHRRMATRDDSPSRMIARQIQEQERALMPRQRRAHPRAQRNRILSTSSEEDERVPDRRSRSRSPHERRNASPSGSEQSEDSAGSDDVEMIDVDSR